MVPPSILIHRRCPCSYEDILYNFHHHPILTLAIYYYIPLSPSRSANQLYTHMLFLFLDFFFDCKAAIIISGNVFFVVHFVHKCTTITEHDCIEYFQAVYGDLKRTQIPIRLAYAMTIENFQGQSFEEVGVFLPESVFSHGQLYVAFSRARSFHDAKVSIIEGAIQGCSGNKLNTRT